LLYTREALGAHSQEKSITALQRYFHKIHKGEGHRLAPHECEYLALRLKSIFRNQEATERVMEPFDQPFLWEAVFKHLLLIYFENLDFLRPVFDGIRELSAEEIERDKLKFEALLEQWRRLFHAPKIDLLLHEVKVEYLRKLAILKRQYEARLFGWFSYRRKCLEQELMAFYIYVTVKTYFKNEKADHIAFLGGGKRFVINRYSYVHIVSRHYIARFNGMDTERSFNSSLPFIDPFSLPSSLVPLIVDYFRLAPAGHAVATEYMIFSFNGEHYLIWWKEKKIAEIGNETGWEIRTLYRIESVRDQEKLAAATVCLERGDGLSFFY
jgi:hypothetical protein